MFPVIFLVRIDMDLMKRYAVLFFIFVPQILVACLEQIPVANFALKI